jgi:uncharacterized protein YdaU (DUF1376 family)
MHYYKRNIGDYAKKAGRLSILEHGVYTLLIDACYDREKFPDEKEAIDWAWARSDDEIAAVRFVLSRFFTLVDGRYVQDRIREEVDAYHAQCATNREIAEKRKHGSTTKRERVVNEASRSVNESPPNQEPRTNNQEPRTIVDAPQSAASKRGSRLDQDWRLPKPWGEWALSEFKTWTEETVRIEAEKFRDFWHAKAGKEASKLDWLATWRNWCRNAKPSSGFNGGGGKYDGAAAAIYGD